MKELLIVGAGGFGRELLQWCKDINAASPTWHIKGFLDDNLHALDALACDCSVVGTIRDWQPGENEVFALAIASPAVKRKVTASLEARGAEFVPVIHPTAYIGDFNRIGKGLVMYPNARITVNTTIGDFVTVLDNTSIGHDARVGDFATFCAGCGINGGVSVGSGAFFGCHVGTVPGVRIGNDAYVGLCSAVVTHVKDGERVLGNPARRIPLPKKS